MNQAGKVKFDSIILAGGFGRRLSPLTDTIPKPMLPIANQSAFIRNMGLLRENGFMNTAVTTMYLPEKIENTDIQSGYVEYIRETDPLGSAGAIGALKSRTEDCILVMSGDSICNYDLKSAKEEFLKSGCDAAILLSRREDSGEYGSVCLCEGKVTELCEKPSVRDTLSDLINTGIYFLSKKALELIPENQFYDFSKDLFPAMMDKSMTIAGIEPKGKWFDIGSFGAYHQCNMWISRGESCIGRHVSIHPGARIENSVIFDNCTIGNSVIRESIIAENAVIGNDCIIPSGCIIGAGAELRDGTVIAPGTIINTNQTLKGEAPIDYFPKPKQKLNIDDDFLIADMKDEGYFVRLGRLLGGEGTVIAFAEGSGQTLQQACELACGAAKAGSNATVISGGNSALASFAAGEYGSRTAFIAKIGDRTEIRLFSSGGMPFSREEIRAISAKEPKDGRITGNVYLLPHGVLIKKYLAHLRQCTPIPTKIGILGGKENRLLKEICEELGIGIDSEQQFGITTDGEKAYIRFSDGNEIPYWRLVTLCCIQGQKDEIILPRDTPNTVESILNRHGVKTRFYGDSECTNRKDAERESLHRDGILLALTAAALAELRGKTMAEFGESIPPFSVMTRAVYADKEKMTSIIAKLREENGNNRNAGFDFGEGRVNVFPSASGRFRLVAEAVDSETAEEISLRAIDLLNK